MIKLKNITMSFGQKEVLKGINLSVGNGKVFGLLGPSGAGKTTIINILIGQLKATSGHATLFKKDTMQLEDKDYQKIGMLLDDCGLYTRLSCHDNLSLFCDIFDVDKKRIDDMLQIVKLENEKKTIVGEMSKGMKQRVAIARAFLHDPELIFLDEPTSGLDPVSANEVHRLVKTMQSQGKTIFLTTHNMEEATKLCDEVALLYKGEIVEYGKPAEICNKYNVLQQIEITLESGEKCSLSNNEQGFAELVSLSRKSKIKSIHSSEPNLEDVFINLTGRRIN